MACSEAGGLGRPTTARGTGPSELIRLTSNSWVKKGVHKVIGEELGDVNGMHLLVHTAHSIHVCLHVAVHMLGMDRSGLAIQAVERPLPDPRKVLLEFLIKVGKKLARVEGLCKVGRLRVVCTPASRCGVVLGTCILVLQQLVRSCYLDKISLCRRALVTACVIRVGGGEFGGW